jgi:hypothetical protein
MMELRHTFSDPTDSCCCPCIGSGPVEGWREVVSSLFMGAKVWVVVRTPEIDVARLNLSLSPCA